MKTRYSRRVWAGFERGFRPWMRRRLDGVHVRGVGGAAAAREIDGLPLLLMANHVSWWDGFLLREVHRAIRPEAPLHVVMLEEELRRVPVFRWMGAVPLSRSPIAARQLLREVRGRLERRPDAVLGYFPQGRIWPSHRRPLGFLRGGGWLAGQLAPVAVLPVGLHLEPLTRPGPAAFVSVGRPLVVRSTVDADDIEDRVTAEVETILACTRRHGEDAARAWTDGAAAGAIDASDEGPAGSAEGGAG